jgi:hypothetical protein
LDASERLAGVRVLHELCALSFNSQVTWTETKDELVIASILKVFQSCPANVTLAVWEDIFATLKRVFILCYADFDSKSSQHAIGSVQHSTVGSVDGSTYADDENDDLRVSTPHVNNEDIIRKRDRREIPTCVAVLLIKGLAHQSSIVRVACSSSLEFLADRVFPHRSIGDFMLSYKDIIEDIVFNNSDDVLSVTGNSIGSTMNAQQFNDFVKPSQAKLLTGKVSCLTFCLRLTPQLFDRSDSRSYKMFMSVMELAEGSLPTNLINNGGIDVPLPLHPPEEDNLSYEIFSLQSIYHPLEVSSALEYRMLWVRFFWAYIPRESEDLIFLFSSLPDTFLASVQRAFSLLINTILVSTYDELTSEALKVFGLVCSLVDPIKANAAANNTLCRQFIDFVEESCDNYLSKATDIRHLSLSYIYGAEVVLRNIRRPKYNTAAKQLVEHAPKWFDVESILNLGIWPLGQEIFIVAALLSIYQHLPAQQKCEFTEQSQLPTSMTTAENNSTVQLNHSNYETPWITKYLLDLMNLVFSLELVRYRYSNTVSLESPLLFPVLKYVLGYPEEALNCLLSPKQFHKQEVRVVIRVV